MAVFRVTNSTTCPSFLIVSVYVYIYCDFLPLDFWISRNNKLPEINSLSLLVIILVGSLKYY